MQFIFFLVFICMTLQCAIVFTQFSCLLLIIPGFCFVFLKLWEGKYKVTVFMLKTGISKFFPSSFVMLSCSPETPCTYCIWKTSWRRSFKYILFADDCLMQHLVKLMYCWSVHTVYRNPKWIIDYMFWECKSFS